MILGNFDTTVASKQLSLLFDARNILARRGQKVVSMEDESKLLFKPSYPIMPKAWEAMKSRSFRRILARITNVDSPRSTNDWSSDLCNSFGEDAIHKTIKKAIDVGFLKSDQNDKLIPGQEAGDFGTTLEWYVAYLFIQELGCAAYWSVIVDGLPTDYDVIVVRDTEIGYIECKSGSVNNISGDEIKNFLHREQALSPAFSMIIVDDASKDSLKKVAHLAIENSPYYSFHSPGMLDRVWSIVAEDYRDFIRLAPINCFLVGSKPDLARNIMRIFQFLTTVCGRYLPQENEAAKEKFK